MALWVVDTHTNTQTYFGGIKVILRRMPAGATGLKIITELVH